MGAQDLSDVVGDPEAFEAFYRRHVTVISRFLARLTLEIAVLPSAIPSVDFG